MAQLDRLNTILSTSDNITNALDYVDDECETEDIYNVLTSEEGINLVSEATQSINIRDVSSRISNKDRKNARKRMRQINRMRQNEKLQVIDSNRFKVKRIDEEMLSLMTCNPDIIDGCLFYYYDNLKKKSVEIKRRYGISIPKIYYVDFGSLNPDKIINLISH